MRIIKLNDQMVKTYEEFSMVILALFKPLHAKLYRVVGLPDIDGKLTELDQVLNTIALRKVNGIWFIKIEDQSDLEDVLTIFMEMGIPATTVEPDETWCN